MKNEDTIVAVSTPYGVGGIAVIRLSGKYVKNIVDKSWKGLSLDKIKSHTAHLGIIFDSQNIMLDEVVLTYFEGPNSFTGEDVIELSCHGSKWIQRELVLLMINNGARAAEPGEFTRRSFMNGRMDLAQAEGVADVIASSSRASHRMSMMQMNGRFSDYINSLRSKLIDLSSLLELELDFSEEDVEFADREKLLTLTDELIMFLEKLAGSYAAGKAFKEGVPTVIAGVPNAGKSTLLNLLLEDDRAIVSDVPGTTRDIIEDCHEIDGILYRFVDTAGLRTTTDKVEKIGIDKAEERIRKAFIVLWMIDLTKDVEQQIDEVNSRIKQNEFAKHLLVGNKMDLASDEITAYVRRNNILPISAQTGEGIDELISSLSKTVKGEYNPETELLLTNGRHYSAVLKAKESVIRAKEAMMQGLSADFIAQDIRETLHHLSELTGEISTPDLLATIFSRFCIGK